MFFKNNKKLTNLITKVVIFLFVLQLIAPVANAQIPTIDQPTLGQWWSDVQDRIKKDTTAAAEKAQAFSWQKLFEGLVLSASLSVRNATVMLARNFAQDTVNWMASGFKGFEASFHTKTWDGFVQDLEDYTVGKFLDGLRGFAWEELGFDICDPSLDIKVDIMLGLAQEKDRTRARPDCSLEKLVGNYRAIYDRAVDEYRLLSDEETGLRRAAYLTGKFLQDSIEVSTKHSTIGLSLAVNEEMERQQEEIRYAEEKQREENLGMKNDNPWGRAITTPAFLKRGYIMSEQDKLIKQDAELESSLAVITDIPAAVTSALISSFVSEGLKKAMKELVFKGITKESYDYVPPSAGALGYVSSEKTQKRIDQSFGAIDVKRVSIDYNPKQIDLLNEFTNCPQERQQYNCVMDHNFAQAVRAATQDKPMTLREAISNDYINDQMIFIHQEDERNNLPNCYEMGFCYSNLVKMRMARIIPIGWEIAASMQKVLDQPITLKQIMDDFDVDGSVFEGLIDPDWILKYPQMKCNAEGYSNMLVAGGAKDRSDYCADIQHCVKTDESGDCIAWGYCAAEENVWRFGAEECFAPYDSCRTLSKRNETKSVNYLLKTVDKSVCNTENAGCSWYTLYMTPLEGSGLNCQKWDDTVDQYVECDEIDPDCECNYEWNWAQSATDSSHDNLASSIIRLNKNIEDNQCNSNNEGCTRFVRTKVDLGANLIPNSSFEENNATETELIGKTVQGLSGTYNLNNENTHSGEYSIVMDDGQNMQMLTEAMKIPAKPYKRYFAVSAYVNKQIANSTISIEDLITDNNFEAELVNGTHYHGTALADVVVGEWKRIYAIYEVTPPSAYSDEIAYVSLVPSFQATNGQILIDDIMLEEISSPATALIHAYSQYNSTDAESVDFVTYLKKAPEYLNCYNTNTDTTYGLPSDSASIAYDDDAKKDDRGPFPRSCENFAQLCTAQEVGCDAYEPTDNGSIVHGVTAFPDYCPVECVGYQAFNKSSSFYEDSEFPIYAIPSNALTCNASQVGCDEFTNLDELAAGGEAQEYYSQLKHCVKLPDNQGQCRDFYTWTTSATAGYQLQRFFLKDIDGDNAPDMIDSSLADECDADIFSSGTNPDCQEFYDENGNVSYRLFSNTITCSEDCHPYRRTIQYASETDCTNRNGTWDSDNSECIFMAIPGEGVSCSASNAGCREYRGNFAGDEEIVYETDFDDWDSQSLHLVSTDAQPRTLESGAALDITGFGFSQLFTQDWIFGLEGEPAGGDTSYSLATNPAGINFSSYDSGDYLISFWAKRQTPIEGFAESLELQITVENNTASLFESEQLAVFNNWKYYTFRFSVDENFTGNESVILYATYGENIYLDNFKITKIQDVNYLIKDSWYIPASCDNELAYQPTNENDRRLMRAMVGCREYQDSDDTLHYLKGFSSLCTADKVGCEALIDTKNTSAFAPEQISLANSVNSCDDGSSCRDDNDCLGIGSATCTQKTAEIRFNPDELIYLVNNTNKQCPASQKGCTALGQPELVKVVMGVEDNGVYINKPIQTPNRVDNKEVFYDYFYKLDLDNLQTLPSALCKIDELACEEYATDEGDTYYFKDPLGRLCEYRKGTNSLGQTKDGWWQKKSNLEQFDYDVPCETSDYYKDGVEHLARNNDDNIYESFVGLCEDQADLCTAFIDPSDRSDPQGDLKDYFGQTYYYLNDDNIDKSSCSTVDQNNGCIMLNDTSRIDENGNFAYENWNSYYTYYRARQSNGSSTYIPYAHLSTLENDLYNGNFDCSSYEYCKPMEICLTQTNLADGTDNIVDMCFGQIADIDAVPSTPLGSSGEHEYVCAVIDVNNEDEAAKNAYCTAKQLLQPDSNVIVKVEKDRECASWYACKSKHWVWDSSLNKYIENCDNLGLCTSLSKSYESAECESYIVSETNRNLLSLNEPFVFDVTAPTDVYESYKNRLKNWYDVDYSGYATPGVIPFQYYTAIDIVNYNYCADSNGNIPNANPTVCESDADCNSSPYLNCEAVRYCDGDVLRGTCTSRDQCNNISDNYVCPIAGDICISSKTYCENGDECMTDGRWVCQVVGEEYEVVCDRAALSEFTNEPVLTNPDFAPNKCTASSERVIKTDVIPETCHFEYNICSDVEACVEQSFNTPVCSSDEDTECTRASCDDLGPEACPIECKLPYPQYRLVNFQSDITGARCSNDSECEPWCDVDDPDSCKCVQGLCVQGSFPGEEFTKSVEPTCRAYPRADSPFPKYLENNPMFEAVNFSYIDESGAALREKNDYGCFYKEVDYSTTETKYYANAQDYRPNVVDGFCTDDESIECSCDPEPASDDPNAPSVYINNSKMCSSNDCEGTGDSAGMCSKADKNNITIYDGWGGYCLQEDQSINIYNEEDRHPCLIWYPAGNLLGMRDARNIADEAGFEIATEYGDGDPHFCLEADRWEKRFTYVARTDGRIDCYHGEGAYWHDQDAKYKDDAESDLTSMNDFLALDVDEDSNAGSFDLNDDIGNMININTQKGNYTPTIKATEAIPEDQTFYSNNPWWEYLSTEENYINVWQEYTGYDDNNTNKAPQIPDPTGEQLNEYKAYLDTLKDQTSCATNTDYWTADCLTSRPNDALTFSRALTVMCGTGRQSKKGNSEGAYDLCSDYNDGWTTMEFHGPQCPEGYRPGLVTFLDWARLKGKCCWGINDRCNHSGYSSNYLSDYENYIVMHHECVPEYIVERVNNSDQWPNSGWFYDEGSITGEGVKSEDQDEDEVKLLRQYSLSGIRNDSDLDGEGFPMGETADQTDEFQNFSRDILPYSGYLDTGFVAQVCGDGKCLGDEQAKNSSIEGTECEADCGSAPNETGCGDGVCTIEQEAPLEDYNCANQYSDYDFISVDQCNAYRSTMCFKDCGRIAINPNGTNPPYCGDGGCYAQSYTYNNETYIETASCAHDCPEYFENSGLYCGDGKPGGFIGNTKKTAENCPRDFGTIEYGNNFTKYWFEPSPAAASHVRYGSSSGEQDINSLDPRLFEIDAPVCSKVVQINSCNNATPIYTDNYYQYKENISSPLGLCGATSSGGNASSLLPEFNNQQIAYSGSGVGFLGALNYSGSNNGPDGNLNGISGLFMYTNPDGVDNDEKGLNYESKIYNDYISGSITIGNNQTANYGGAMCFDITKEKLGNTSQWQLRKLFAKAYQIYDHTAPEEDEDKAMGAWTYEETDDDFSGWDDTENENRAEIGVFAPIVAAPLDTGTKDISGLTLMGAKPLAFNVNGQSQGDIYKEARQLPVTISFYAWADKNAMPIRNIVVAWGDNGSPSSSGPDDKYKNRKPRCQRQDGEKLGTCVDTSSVNPVQVPGYSCSADENCKVLGENYLCSCHLGGINNCNSFNAAPNVDTGQDRWGDTIDSCMEGTFQYNNVYTCEDPASLAPCDSPGVSEGEGCKYTDDNGEIWCRFQPKVMVEDNWGWCNVSDSYVGTRGNKCNISRNNAGQYYDGYIYLKPPAVGEGAGWEYNFE